MAYGILYFPEHYSLVGGIVQPVTLGQEEGLAFSSVWPLCR